MALRLVASTLKGKGRAVYPILADCAAREASSQSIRAIASTTAIRDVASITAASSSTHPIQITPVPLNTNAISLLQSQPLHYVIASIAGRTLLLHPHDLITLPRLNDVEIGDVIELDRIHEVGSRDYTLRAQDPMGTRRRGADARDRVSTNTHQAGLLEMLREAAKEADEETLSGLVSDDGGVKESQSWAARLKPGGLAHVGSVLDSEIVRVRCTVVEHTKGKMEFIVKKKRRKGYKKTIKHKQTYTRLRVEGIQLGPQTI